MKKEKKLNARDGPEDASRWEVLETDLSQAERSMKRKKDSAPEIEKKTTNELHHSQKKKVKTNKHIQNTFEEGIVKDIKIEDAANGAWTVEESNLIEGIPGNSNVSKKARDSTESRRKQLIDRIPDDIEALKAASDWPNETETPEFNDESNTIYLEFVPKEKGSLNEPFKHIFLHLPHPLSLDRRVCYISNDDLTKEQKAEIKQKLREAGVLGKIKVVPQSLVDTAIEEKDDEAIARLAEKYDTYFLDSSIKSFSLMDKQSSFLKEFKCCISSSVKTFGTDLAKTVLWKNLANTAYFIKVGHTGLTNQQLQENITSVVNDVTQQNNGISLKGLASVELIHLKTGSIEGVTIHEDRKVHIRFHVVDDELLASIGKLRRFADWPSTKGPPAFQNLSFTVFLELALKNFYEASSIQGFPKLPHPLSMNRSVCFLLDNDADVDAVKDAVVEAPVTGRVNVLHARMARNAFNSGDELALNAMAKRYDTVLHNMADPSFLKPFMAQQMKADFPLSDLRESLWDGLSLTAYFANETKTRLTCKVGHMGLTDKQLAENVQAVFANCKEYPVASSKVGDIALRTGRSDRIWIFEDQKMPKPRKKGAKLGRRARGANLGHVKQQGSKTFLRLDNHGNEETQEQKVLRREAMLMKEAKKQIMLQHGKSTREYLARITVRKRIKRRESRNRKVRCNHLE